jgi:hypothetical protein
MEGETPMNGIEFVIARTFAQLARAGRKLTEQEQRFLDWLSGRVEEYRAKEVFSYREQRQ